MVTIREGMVTAGEGMAIVGEGKAAAVEGMVVVNIIAEVDIKHIEVAASFIVEVASCNNPFLGQRR